MCSASFTLGNGERYQCASHVNGGACSNTISVSKALVESRVLDQIRKDLRDPDVVREGGAGERHRLEDRPAARPVLSLPVGGIDVAMLPLMGLWRRRQGRK